MVADDTILDINLEHKKHAAKESVTMAAWRAEEVKNWTQALANLNDMGITQDKHPKLFQASRKMVVEIMLRINSLLGIADDNAV